MRRSWGCISGYLGESLRKTFHGFWAMYYDLEIFGLRMGKDMIVNIYYQL